MTHLIFYINAKQIKIITVHRNLIDFTVIYRIQFKIAKSKNENPK